MTPRATSPRTGRTRDRVTVVVTTCERPLDSLQRAVTSASEQRAVDVEVIVVDDSAQPWVTPQMVGGVTVLHTTGRVGVNRARNVGLAEASAPWITFLDDDDELRPDFARRCLQAVRTSPLPQPVGAVAGCEERDAHRTWSSHPRGNVVRDGPLAPMVGIGTLNGFVVPTETLRRAGGWPEAFDVAGLTDLYCRLRQLVSLHAVPEPLYVRHHRPDPARLSRQWQRRAKAYEQTYQRNREVLRAQPDLRMQWLVLRSDAHLRAGNWALAVSRAGAALLHRPHREHARLFARAVVGPRAWRRRQQRRGLHATERAHVDVPELTHRS